MICVLRGKTDVLGAFFRTTPPNPLSAPKYEFGRECRSARQAGQTSPTLDLSRVQTETTFQNKGKLMGSNQGLSRPADKCG